MNANQVKRTVLERDLTLIEWEGLNNIELLIRQLRKGGVHGDFVETGVWKGGACLFARAMMNEVGMRGTVYACDSYKGLPPPDEFVNKLDAGDIHYTLPTLAVPLDEVKGYFKEFDLEEGVEFVEGMFQDTLPSLKEKIQDIAILRLDGDMYGSTIVALDNLYDKVVIGGCIIVDDYCIDRARWATDDFRRKRGIADMMLYRVNNGIHYWQKTRV